MCPEFQMVSDTIKGVAEAIIRWRFWRYEWENMLIFSAYTALTDQYSGAGFLPAIR